MKDDAGVLAAGKFGLTFASLLIAFLAFLPCSVNAAETNSPSSPQSGNRWLLIVGTPYSMQFKLPGLLKTVKDLLGSDLNGQLQPGDTLGVWTYNQELQSGRFPLQIWSPARRGAVTEGVVEFLRKQRFEKEAYFESVVPAVNEVVRQSKVLTVVLISGAESEIRGTPFDRELNDLYRRWRGEQQRNRMPFVTVLRALDGRITSFSASPAPWPLEMPPLPLPEQAPIVKEKPQPAPVAKDRPAVTPPPLILSGRQSKAPEVAKSETIPPKPEPIALPAELPKVEPATTPETKPKPEGETAARPPEPPRETSSEILNGVTNPEKAVETAAAAPAKTPPAATTRVEEPQRPAEAVAAMAQNSRAESTASTPAAAAIQKPGEPSAKAQPAANSEAGSGTPPLPATLTAPKTSPWPPTILRPRTKPNPALPGQSQTALKEGSSNALSNVVPANQNRQPASRDIPDPDEDEEDNESDSGAQSAVATPSNTSTGFWMVCLSLILLPGIIGGAICHLLRRSKRAPHTSLITQSVDKKR